LLVRELLSGEAAYDVESTPVVDVLQAMADPKLAPIVAACPDASAAVAAALERALEPSADARSISAAEMHTILEGAVDDSAGRAALAIAVNRTRTGDRDETPENQASEGSQERLTVNPGDAIVVLSPAPAPEPEKEKRRLELVHETPTLSRPLPSDIAELA